MSRQLHEVEVVGLSVWAWTVLWFAGGMLLGFVVAILLARSCWKWREGNTKARGYTATSPNLSSSLHQRTAPDFASKPDGFSGSIADSAGYCNTDSLSVSHWRSGTRALDPVIESDSIPPTELVAARPHKSLGVDTEKSPPVSPVRNEDGMTVQLYPAFSGSSKTQVAESTSPNQPGAIRPTAQQQTSLPGSAGTQSARATSAGGSTSGGSGAGGPVRSSGGYKPGVASVQHARNVSTVSSTGASPEYEEDDLDEDWRMLLEEVNGLLASKNYTPIRNAKERATVVNSLLVSTSTRDRSECVRNAAIDMLTFRKMNTGVVGKQAGS